MDREGDRPRALAVVATLAAVAAALALAPSARAQFTGLPVIPILGDPLGGNQPQFIGAPAQPDPVARNWTPPQHPFMAPDPNNNLHNDAYMTDAYEQRGPLGRGTRTSSTLFARECGSVTFDKFGRIVTVCVGLDRPVLALLSPNTLHVLAHYDLPLRDLAQGGNPFTGFAGGGYFYLDHRDRAVIPTTTRHIFVVGQTSGRPGFALERDYNMRGAVGPRDAIISALPDWRGRIWFASVQGVVGWVNPDTGTVFSERLGERIHNSFAVDETGGVFIVSDAALYRFEARPGGVRTSWRRPYPNVGTIKPGQTQAGSGTTPTLIGANRIAITDNADPMNVVVYRRGADSNGAKVCGEPLFEPGRSATDQSLVAANNSLIAENNFGYTGPAQLLNDNATTAPGLQRVDVRDGRCETVWRSSEIAPSVVPKVSLGAGLVYTYTRPRAAGGSWYFTALDFDTGATVFKRLAGDGLGYNNNYAPVTIGPNGTAYVGVLGGLTLFRDAG